MKTELSTGKNGSTDYMIDTNDLFDEAMIKETAEDLIDYVAKGGNLSIDKSNIMTPVALATLAKPSDCMMDLDKPNTWHSGLKLALLHSASEMHWRA